MRILEGHIRKRDKGRNFWSRSRLDLLHFYTFISAFLPFLASCRETISNNDSISGIEITKAAEGELSYLDLFFFNNDELGRLDSYQRFDYSGASAIYGASRTGRKKVAAIANIDSDSLSWSQISSHMALSGIKARLDSDNPARPIMSGSTAINAGKDPYCTLSLRPILSEVCLRSIVCDFSSRKYQDSKLENVKVYLSNVNTSWPIFADSLSVSSDYINIGQADSTMISKLKHPEYVYADLKTSIGNSIVKPDLHFFCYPNAVKEESMGSPFTRLVIEGTIDGKTYYYPLNVNRRNEAEGIVRNCRYILDVKLTRLGTTDPDTAMDTESAEVTLSINQWSEKEGQYVSF